ncbi:MAG: phage major capsid protein [Candidatus Onthovivens sp.]|nr:phage major capsid protein [Candidatus Onthovivens sp.]
MKEMLERQNDLKNKAEEIVNTAKAENRAVTEEEKNNFDSIMKEINDIENTIEMEEKLNNMETKEIKVEDKISLEEKEVHEFANYIRNAATQMTKGENGAVIPTTIANKIIAKVVEISPIYASATKYNAKGTLVIPKVDTTADDVTCSYAEEFSELVEHSNKFATVTLTGYLIGALTKISKSLLNNSDFDLVNYVVERMAEKFKVFYEGEMLNGTNDKISGIVGSYDSNNMKVTLASKSAVTSDELIDIQELVPDVYQANAYWVMNRSTRKAIRKLKDGDGNYLLQRVFNQKWDYELLGRPVYASENAKELGTVSMPVIFYGDFSGLGVKNTEELEISVLMEKFATQHAIGVCGYSELDAKVENTQKIAVAFTADV